jgi:methyltransferase-like protein
VLEIGCASGGNLLPMAAGLPSSTFIGIDYSSKQINDAEKSLGELGLKNVTFLCEDIRRVDTQSLGTFDYVIAHGIYSWLPADAQEALLKLYRDCLADDGIGYISYNTLPGWRMRGIVRDMMLFHAELFSDEQTRIAQAKALLDFVSGAIPADKNPYGLYLQSELQRVNQSNDSYLRHDHLEEHNEPLYFRDFMARCNVFGLQYLGESEFPSMVGRGFAAPVHEKLMEISSDVIRHEQYMDFVRNRTFRQTLLVRNGESIQRTVKGHRLSSLHVSSKIIPSDPAACVTDESNVAYTVADGTSLNIGCAVTKTAFSLLAEVYPATIPIKDLVQLAREKLSPMHRSMVAEKTDFASLVRDLLVAFTGHGVVFLRDVPLVAVAKASDQPTASAYARWQSATTRILTNLRHDTIVVDEPAGVMLPELDGTNDRAALLAILHQHIAKGRLQVTANGQSVIPELDSRELALILSALLESFARDALLVS